MLRLSRTKIYQKEELTDQSSSLAFRIPTFGGGVTYISSLFFDSQDNPSIYLAIPIVKPGSPQELAKLTTSSQGEFRRPGEILGVLRANIKLTDFWDYIQSYKIGENGYVFLVDDKGGVIAHKDQKFSKALQNLRDHKAINSFLKSLTTNAQPETSVTQDYNEYGQLSLMDYKQVTPTNWGVITQIPLSEVLKETDRITVFVIVLIISLLMLILISSFWLTKKIVKPIEDLQVGSKNIGQGNLDFRIAIHTRDEIEQLGNEFNSMASNLAQAFKNLKNDKNIIAAERNKLITTLSSIADAIIAVDLEKNIIIFNRKAEDLTGFKTEEVAGRKIYDVFHIFDDDHELNHSEYCPVQTAYGEGSVFNKESLLMVANGKETYINLIVKHIKEGIATNLGCILVIHDVTKERELERMKLDFVSMAAHELRTPLTAIRGYLSIFMSENKDKFNEEQGKFLERISISANQLMVLIENLLSVSRIERGAFTVNLEQADWVPIIEKVVEDLADRAKDKNIALEFKKPDHPISQVYADKLRIVEVLTNLIANAISYTYHNGHVTVSVEEKDNEVVTHVKDNGEGIPNQAQRYLFTKFFRVAGKLAQGSKGTGLGLYISKSIVEKHNGTIWVESKPGKGSTFSFSLPTKS